MQSFLAVKQLYKDTVLEVFLLFINMLSFLAVKQLYKDTVLEVFLLFINMLSFLADKAVIQRHCIRGTLTVY